MLALAWRNLWRQRGRGIATLSAVAFVVALVLIMFGMLGGLMNASYQDITQRGGHVQVRVQNHRDVRDFDALLLRDVDTTLKDIEALDDEALAVPVLEVPALAAGDTRSRGIRITGVSHPERLKDAFASDYLAAGQLPDAGDLEGIVLGATLARALQVELGDEVFLYAPGTDGIGAAAYTLIGVLELNDPVIEGRSVYLSLEAAQELAAPGGATRVEVHLPHLVRLSDDDTVVQFQTALGNTLSDSSVETWRQVEPAQAAVIDVMNPILTGIAVIFFVLAGLMVVNTTYLSLMERIHEFGTIISLGATPRKVMRMVITESLVLCLTDRKSVV